MAFLSHQLYAHPELDSEESRAGDVVGKERKNQMNANLAPSSAMLRRVVIASVLGNAFEWFDFAIYGLFVSTIAKLYFPAGSALVSLMLALATFGGAFAVRPLGGLVLGMYGDRVGRKRALSVTIALMATGTAIIGVLPTYAAIGVAAPIMIVLARLIQGFSAGGEFSGATTMLVEFGPAKLRGFIASFQMCSQALTFACGAAVAWLLSSHLSVEQFETWGWRLPFLFGILVGPVGWIIRQKVDESPEFLAFARDEKPAKKSAQRSPLWELVRFYSRETFAGTGIAIVGTASSYIFVFFVPIFAKKQLWIAAADVNLATLLSAAIILLLSPLAGYLSDRIGRKTILIPGILGYGTVAWILFRQLISAPSLHTLLMLQIGVSIFMSFIWGPIPIVLTELFPVHIRSTGVAITYNVAVLNFGGLAPFINTWLVKVTGNNFSPVYYVECSVVIGLLGTLLLHPRLPNLQASALGRFSP